MATIASPSGFDAMGHPIPASRRQRAYKWLRSDEIGLSQEQAYTLVGQVASALERDEPHCALDFGRDHLDLTGAYRLMAYLLTGD